MAVRRQGRQGYFTDHEVHIVVVRALKKQTISKQLTFATKEE